MKSTSVNKARDSQKPKDNKILNIIKVPDFFYKHYKSALDKIKKVYFKHSQLTKPFPTYLTKVWTCSHQTDISYHHPLNLVYPQM